METRRNPLIASGLCEIGFVWLFFLSLVERDGGLRGLALQNSERVKCLRPAVNDWLRLGPLRSSSLLRIARVSSVSVRR